MRGNETLVRRLAPRGSDARGSGDRFGEGAKGDRGLNQPADALGLQGRTDEVVLNSYVSTGRAGFDTPIGSFAVLTKLPSQTMEGVIGGEYYNVPDVPWVLYFTNRGHALHGTYWHNNFGMPMSHGCVNLPLDVAAWFMTGLLSARRS